MFAKTSTHEGTVMIAPLVIEIFKQSPLQSKIYGIKLYMTCSSELSVSRRLGLAVIWRTFIKKSHNKRLLYKQHSRWECPPPSPYVFFVQNSIAIVGSLGLFCPFNSPETKGSASLSSQSPFDILIPCQCFSLESKNILFVCKFYHLKLVLKNVICVPTFFGNWCISGYLTHICWLWRYFWLKHCCL